VAVNLAVRTLLSPLALLYGAAVRVRNAHYDRLPQPAPVDVPVISVGNLTVGGSGKTPIVIEIVRWLHELGRRPAILTRGYGATRGQTADEVLEFAEALPEVPVVVDPDRVAGARRAVREHGVDCLVLDDGFQHRRLPRTLDIVVIDALEPWGGGWLLPVGRLREPLSGLARADLFIIARCNQVAQDAVLRIEETLTRHNPDAPIAFASVVADGVRFADCESRPPEELGYWCVLPVCGLGNPATFLQLIEPLAGRVCAPLTFGDHHRYRAGDVRRIQAAARARGADLVLTTRKDWVKLTPLWCGGESTAVDADRESKPPTLARLDVRLEIDDPEGGLEAALVECAASAPRSGINAPLA